MRYEVEQKFPIGDLGEIERHLITLGAVIEPPVVQVDLYFAHPARDFAQTDEALRIRRVGDESFITYKGAKIDQATKTRSEIELPLSTGEQSVTDWSELLEALGFRPVANVRKSRWSARLQWQGREVEVALDEVDGLGKFVELEIHSDEAEVQTAMACLASLAAELGLGQGERRSYLELLLGKTHPPSAVG
jgi:adenylate cyclase, class 2